MTADIANCPDLVILRAIHQNSACCEWRESVIDDVVLELAGRRYRWTCDPKNSSAKDCWSWSDEQSFMTPPTQVIAELNRKLIETEAQAIAETIDDDDDFVRLHDILRSMGATDADFNADTLITCIEVVDPELFTELQFESFPPTAHTPFNCRELRAWFFLANGPQVAAPRFVICVGNGPFNKLDFDTFLLGRLTIPITYPSAHNVGPVGHVVIGRENWDESDVDALIDHHRGQSLRIYSQEMFTAILGCGRDPFAAGPEVLAAFRAGHPGLEFVSEGWPGWVNTSVPNDRSQRTSRTMPGENWRQESPLHVLGYQVGKNGLPKNQRRALLRVAFEGELPNVGDAQYMGEWGDPKSPARLKKIANFLSSNCRNQKKKEHRSEKAIEDWEEDLEWMRMTFYHGHFMFHWPDTVV